MFSRSIWVAACCLSLSLLLYAQAEGGFSSNQRTSRIRDLEKRGPQAIPALAEYLSDPDRGIRVEAVKAIVKADTEASLTPLAKATHDTDAEIQIRSTDGIINFYLPGYVARGGLTGPLTRGVRQVKSFFSSRNDQVIDADVIIRPDVSQALADEIRGGGNVDARANAALAAGILHARATVPALVEVLRAKDSQLIFESLVALQKIHDPDAGPRVSVVAHDLDDRVQATALETIGILHSVASAPDVRSALQNARNMRIRRAALEALAMLGLAEDRTTFLQYVEDRDADLRAAALEGLGRVREPQDYAALQAAYDEKDADSKVHLAAAFALVDEGKVDTSDFSPLSYLVENLDVKARSGTASAYLTELARHADVRKALIPLIPQATKDQKIALCSIFAGSESDEALPVLNNLARDIDPDVAFAASKALRIAQARKPS